MARRLPIPSSLLLLTGLLPLVGCATVPRNDGPSDTAPTDTANQPIIRAVLAHQADEWNRGSITGFMQAYWPSDDLTFSSGGRTNRGFDDTLAAYQQTYPTPEKMGLLTFDNLEVHPLGDEHALVLGRWHLKYSDHATGGNYSLVFALIDDQWRIIHDHTSMDPAEVTVAPEPDTAVETPAAAPPQNTPPENAPPENAPTNSTPPAAVPPQANDVPRANDTPKTPASAEADAPEPAEQPKPASPPNAPNAPNVPNTPAEPPDTSAS